MLKKECQSYQQIEGLWLSWDIMLGIRIWHRKLPLEYLHIALIVKVTTIQYAEKIEQIPQSVCYSLRAL
jgi:hypothetical protein